MAEAGAGVKVGAMLVELLLDDQQFKAALGTAEKSLKATAERFDAFGAKINSMVVSGFQAATAAALAFGAAVIKVGSDFEREMTRVAALQGVAASRTDATYAALEDKARQLGRDTMFTATQAAQALTLMAQAGMSASESIGTADAALNLAGASGVGIADSVELIVSVMRQFGMTSSDTTRIVDVLSKGMRTSLLDFSSLREAMKYAGTAGAGFGMSLEETVAAVAQFRNLGLEGSLAGNAFKMSMLQATQATDANREILARYNLKLEDVNAELHSFAEILGTVAKANMTTTDAAVVFGARAGASFAKLAQEVRLGRVDLDAYTASLEASAGQTAEMYDTMLTSVSARTEILLSSIEEVFLATFDGLKGPLGAFLDYMTISVNDFSLEMAAGSGRIREAWSGAFRELGNQVGGTFQTTGELVVELIVKLGNLTAMFARMLPTLKMIAIAMLAIFITQQVNAFAVAVNQGVVAMIKMAQAMTTGAAAASATSLAFGAIGVAVAAVTLGLAAYEKQVTALERRANVYVSATNTELVGRYEAKQRELNATLERQQAILKDLQDQKWKDQASRDRESQGIRGLITETERLIAVNQNSLNGAREAEFQARQRKVTADNAAAAAKEEEEARKKALEELQAELELQRKGITTKALAAAGTKENTEAIKAMGDEVERLFKELEKIKELEQFFASANLSAEFNRWAASMGDFTSPGAIDSLRSLSAAVADLVPPAELSRVEQLQYLLAQVLAESAKAGPEAQAAFDGLAQSLRDALSAEEKGAGLRDLQEALAPLVEIGGKVRDIFGDVGDALRTAAGWAKQLASAGTNLLSTLTGGNIDFSLRGLLDLIQQAASGEEGQTAADLFETAADAALAFVETLVTQFPSLIDKVINLLPKVIQAAIDAFPVLLQGIIRLIPEIAPSILEAIGQSLKDSRKYMPTLLQLLVDLILDVIQVLAEQAPLLVTAIVKVLPSIVDAIIQALPDIILALADSLPVLIEAIIRAIPKIIWAIIRGLPAIVWALVQLVYKVLRSIIGTVWSVILEFVWAKIGSLVEIVWTAITGAIKKALGVIKDTFREAFTLGRAETATYGDTPHPILAGASGLMARFAPGDIVVASQSLDGILRQVAGQSGPPAAQRAAPAAPASPASNMLHRLQVVIGNEVVEDLMLGAARSGRAPTVQRLVKGAKSVQTGLSSKPIVRI